MWILYSGWTFPLSAFVFCLHRYTQILSFNSLYKAVQAPRVCPPDTSKPVFHNIYWIWHAGKIHVLHENHLKGIWLYQYVSASILNISSFYVLSIVHQRLIFILYMQTNLHQCYSSVRDCHPLTQWLHPRLSENQQTVKEETEFILKSHCFIACKPQTKCFHLRNSSLRSVSAKGRSWQRPER